MAFVFDRPRRVIALAEGIDRKHPALLLTVGLHLPHLAALPGVNADPVLFLQKLGSLARLGAECRSAEAATSCAATPLTGRH